MQKIIIQKVAPDGLHYSRREWVRRSFFTFFDFHLALELEAASPKESGREGI
jgi:hypothetical protein